MDSIDEKISSSVKNYRFIMFVTGGISYSIMCFFSGLLSSIPVIVASIIVEIAVMVISPYFILLFKRGGSLLAGIHGLACVAVVVIADAFKISAKAGDRRFTIGLVVFAALLAAIAAARVLEIRRRTRRTARQRELFKSIQILTAAVCLFSIIASVPTAVCLNNADWEGTDKDIISSSVEPTNDAEMLENSMIKAHIKMLAPITDGSFKNLSLGEKLDIMQTIVNIECTYFGCSTAVAVKAKTIENKDKEITFAYFVSEKDTIYVNKKVFDKLSDEEALGVILHESYHAYQHQQRKLYNAVPDEYKNLLILSEAKECKEGFDNYISGDDNFDEYKNQFVELQAQKYSNKEKKEYIKLIKKYAKENNN